MTVIKLENLWKEYRLGVISHGTLTQDLQSWWARVRGKEDPNSRLPILQDQQKQIEGDRFWALRDVNLDIKQGEILGIIGKNGAGKSTLLKILSRVTAPTRGNIKIKGRIASLLEVGTGFHPELTGRENIFMNGAILGMSKREIKSKLDEIIDFSGIEDFIETPVKRYSSGMYVRLAFAVSAHLEPEILIIDEVLAVGDAAFQKKCLGKMHDVSRADGRTILFVSHNMAAITKICTHAVLLNQGYIAETGLPNDIVRRYFDIDQTSNGEVTWTDPQTAPGNDTLRLHSVRLVSNSKITKEIAIDEDLKIEIDFWNLKPGTYASSSIHLLDQMGNGVLATGNMHSANLTRDEWFGKSHPVGLFRSVCTIPKNFLNTGNYSINAIILTDTTNIEVFEQEILAFQVHETGKMRKEYIGPWLGVVRPKLAWQTELLKQEVN